MTTHDYKIPMSLSALWARWQELEEGEHGEKEFAEFTALEERLCGDEAENTSDLLAKLQSLHIRKEVEWNDKSERLYQSIVDGYENLVVEKQDGWTRLENAIVNIRGAANCLLEVSLEAEEPSNNIGTYLGGRLLEHAETIDAVFRELHRARFTERDLERLVPPPKPKDAQRDLAKLMVAALGPRATVGGVESVRTALSSMLAALPAPLCEAPAAAEAGAS